MALVDRHTNDFLQAAKKLLPEVRREINEYQGLFHIQIAALARVAQQAITDRANTCIQVTELVGRYFDPTNEHLEAFNNAVHVFFLEHLFFDVENDE